MSDPMEKFPMKCSGMCARANGTAVSSAALTRPWRCSSRVCTTPDHAVSSQMLMRARLTSSPMTCAVTNGATSTGLGVSPKSTASARVSVGSPARTRIVQVAPIRHRHMRRTKP